MRGVELLFNREGYRKYLNWRERELFLGVVQGCPEMPPRAFCITLFYTGCRISEALELTGDHVDSSEGTIVLRTLKRRDSGCYRIVPIPPVLAEMIEGVAADNGDSSARVWPYARVTGYRWVKRYMSMAGIEGVKACPKGLRHSFAVACISRGVPVTTVQRWMGHARLETTAIYLDMTGEEDRSQAEKIWGNP